MAKKALITGHKGQDGTYLAELLREKGYELEGVDKDEGNLLERAFVESLVKKGFDEIYNFASVSTVQSPWENPVSTVESTGMIPLFFLEAIRTHSPKTKLFQASSAEMFGDPQESPQSEKTPLEPHNPYALGKVLAHKAVGTYRDVHNVFAVSGILFNHESPRRPENFVTAKIARTLARIAQGSNEVLELGNLDAKRDWSFAGDIVEAMWLSLQAPKAGDYVFASGAVHTVREFVEESAKALGLSITWKGSGIEEKGYDGSGKLIVSVNPTFFRPPETCERRGDISKAKKILNWQPKTSFETLVKMMVSAK